jgi:hypothetical protein
MTGSYPSYPPRDDPSPVRAADVGQGAADIGRGPEDAEMAQGARHVVRDQAADLGQGAAQAGKHTADVAKDQARNMTAEVGRQGKDLLRQAQSELRDQAGQQQQRLASGMHALSDELSSMAQNASQPAVAADLARQAAGRTRDMAQWLDGRDPEQLVEELKSFARRRPGAFLALAAATGLLAGRLTRGLAGATADQEIPDVWTEETP